jgi:uncharacterized glyoxalase superfamily protein PhnB
MLHVPDVAATAAWYAALGFEVRDIGHEDGKPVWASLAFGDSELMLSAGGQPSAAWRREVDLYLYVDDVDGLFAKIGAGADVVEPPHDTFYGMREFIIRDFNRFWITFGHPLPARSA